MMSKSAPCSSVKVDPFHIVHKVPVGDSPYVKAKHVQLVDRDPVRAIALFWAAINSGDRVDSALKDMAIVMKQQNRAQEAIEAIKSLRGRCSDQAQESLDNVLLDLYKRCGRVEDQIDLLKHKLHLIHQGMAFNGKRTKTARSQGKKFQVSVEQEATRLLGNLGWAYMQQTNYAAAEAVYRKALSIESDNNKVCNLGICLMQQGRLEEAKAMLETVTKDGRWMSDSHIKSFERAQEMLESMSDIERKLSSFTIIEQPRRVLELGNIDPAMKDAFLATSGFGPESLFQSESWPGSSGSDDLDYTSPDESSEGLDRRRTLPPLQQEPMSTWNMMDFTFNPSNLDLGSPATESPSMRASEGLTSEIEMRQQRRLRVFQEMTLPKTLQV